jgi:hypothetical protein
MRKAALVFGAAVAVAVVAVAVAAATGTFKADTNKPKAPTPTGRPTIYASGSTPLRITGIGFQPGEHVRVGAAASGRKASGRTVANAKGSFRVKLSGISGCDSLHVYAVGDKGSRTSFNLSSFVCG